MAACQIATQTCHFRPEGAERHGRRRPATTLGQDRKHQRLNDFVSRALWFLASGRTHLQQAHGKRGQQTRARASDHQHEALAVPGCDTHF